MSVDASRLTPPWVRYGLIAGIVAFACTLAANLAIRLLSPADLCRAGPVIVPLLGLGAFLIFLAMAAAAGFRTGQASASGPDAALAGLLVGVLGGCALVVLLPFIPGVEHRFQELNTLCPDTGSFSAGGSFSFGFGPTPPPGYVIPTPPPEFFASPPPGAFATPPPGAFEFGPVGVLGLVLQMLLTILVGLGFAAGAGALAGLAGRASRARVQSRERI
jgi:hypothetical protein